MEVRFHSVNFDADVKLLDFAQRKINKLDIFYDQIVGGDAYFKVEPSSNRENKWVEIKLRVPGKDLVVKKYDRTFEGAIDQGVDVLRRSLIKHKGKLKPIV